MGRGRAGPGIPPMRGILGGIGITDILSPPFTIEYIDQGALAVAVLHAMRLTLGLQPSLIFQPGR